MMSIAVRMSSSTFSTCGAGRQAGGRTKLRAGFWHVAPFCLACLTAAQQSWRAQDASRLVLPPQQGRLQGHARWCKNRKKKRPQRAHPADEVHRQLALRRQQAGGLVGHVVLRGGPGRDAQRARHSAQQAQQARRFGTPRTAPSAACLARQASCHTRPTAARGTAKQVPGHLMSQQAPQTSATPAHSRA